MSTERVRISACVIAMNEVDRIGRCLDSLAFCDEVLVIDSGSTDGTQELCRQKGARVIETDWPGWVAQKNRAVEAAAHDWILSLDADERVDEALRDRIQALRDDELGAAGGPVAYAVCRKVWYLGRWIRHGGWYPEWRLRLFDRRQARWGGIDPHDTVETEGPTARIRPGDLEHYTYRSVQDHIRQMNRFTSVAADELVRRGRKRPFLGVVFRPPWHFVRMYVLRCGFLDGKAGFMLAWFDAFYTFLKYTKFWEQVQEVDPPA